MSKWLAANPGQSIVRIGIPRLNETAMPVGAIMWTEVSIAVTGLGAYAWTLYWLVDSIQVIWK